MAKKQLNLVKVIASGVSALLFLVAFFMQFLPSLKACILQTCNDVDAISSLYGNELYSFNTGLFIGYYVLLIAAILMILSIFLKGKVFTMIFIFGSIGLAVFGAIMIFCAVPLFCTANGIPEELQQAYSLAYGAILGGVFTCIGGVTALISFFAPKFSKK